MPSTSRTGWLVFAAAALLGAAACASAPESAQSCQSTAECPADARCISGACVANAPPVPDVALPAAPLTMNELLTFDASSSTDPDDGDSVASYGWRFVPLAAPCSAPVSASTGPQASVRFACPGRYGVEVSATDRMSASATVTKKFEVVVHTGSPPVVVGADIEDDHVCSAPPAHCTPVSGSVQLSSDAPGFAPEAVSYLWTVEPPPERPLDANRRVTFSPSSTDPSPSVLIETDGQAISGDWIFRVQVTDVFGVVGTGAMRVSIKNRLPTVHGGPPPVDHAFDGAQFTASGQAAVILWDPDGDGLFGRSVAWRHTGDGDSLFDGVDFGDHVTFEVAVPYTAPADAAHLIGTAARSIEVSVTDVNGGVPQPGDQLSYTIANRPPTLHRTLNPVSVPHTFDAAAGAYEAAVPLSEWADADGDPIEWASSVPSGDPQCSTGVFASGVASALCSVPFDGAPDVGQLVGPHVVQHKVKDPWADSVDPLTVSFEISNRAPTLSTTVVGAATACSYSDVCCRSTPDGCEALRATGAAASVTVTFAWTDPDGDPLSMTAGASGSIMPLPPFVCTSSGCQVPLMLAEVSICDTLLTTLPTTATDGVAMTTSSVIVDRMCSI